MPNITFIRHVEKAGTVPYYWQDESDQERSSANNWDCINVLVGRTFLAVGNFFRNWAKVSFLRARLYIHARKWNSGHPWHNAASSDEVENKHVALPRLPLWGWGQESRMRRGEFTSCNYLSTGRGQNKYHSLCFLSTSLLAAAISSFQISLSR